MQTIQPGTLVRVLYHRGEVLFCQSTRDPGYWGYLSTRTVVVYLGCVDGCWKLLHGDKVGFVIGDVALEEVIDDGELSK